MIRIGLLAAMLLSLSGCVEEHLLNRPANDEADNVLLVYEWEAGMTLPENHFLLRFYPLDGGEPLTFRTSYWGFEGRVPPGAYQVLAFTDGVKGLGFVNTDDYMRAKAVALPDEENRDYYDDPEQLLQQAGQLFTVSSNRLVISPQGRTEQHYPVRLLNSRVFVTVHNQTGQEAMDVTCRLRGLSFARLLSNGDADFDAGIGEHLFTMSFDRYNDAATQLSCLGFFNPEPDKDGVFRYQSLLDITVTYESRAEEELVEDITEEVADELGKVDIARAIQLNIALLRDDEGKLTVSITVTPWDGDINMNVEV
jgi:hypothetical protein